MLVVLSILIIKLLKINWLTCIFPSESRFLTELPPYTDADEEAPKSEGQWTLWVTTGNDEDKPSEEEEKKEDDKKKKDDPKKKGKEDPKGKGKEDPKKKGKEDPKKKKKEEKKEEKEEEEKKDEGETSSGPLKVVLTVYGTKGMKERIPLIKGQEGEKEGEEGEKEGEQQKEEESEKKEEGETEEKKEEGEKEGEGEECFKSGAVDEFKVIRWIISTPSELNCFDQTYGWNGVYSWNHSSWKKKGPILCSKYYGCC